MSAAQQPTSEEALAELVRDELATRRPIAALGNGTKRHHGPAARAGATAVSLRGLDRITSYEPGDLVVSVQAGVRLADLQRTLGARGQWLPIDPPYADATIGGVLATASAGPRRLGYGTAKDQLLGLRVLGPRGVVTKSGGRVVKNVTGYDLHKLHVGAFGSLGVIIEAHFKVRPRPQESGAVVLGFADLEAAHRLLLEVWTSALRPVALEALAGAAAAGLRAALPGLPDGGALAVVGVEGSRPVFDRHARELEALRGRATGVTVVRAGSAERLWAALRDAPERLRDAITVRVGAWPQQLPDLLRDLRVADRTGDLAVHAATGVARAHLRGVDAAAAAACVRGWQERAAREHGYAVVEAAPVDLPGRGQLPFGAGAPAIGAALRRAFDPDDLMNPGRMPV